MKKPLAFMLLVWVLSIGSYIGGVYCIAFLVRYYPPLAPFVFVDTHGGSSFSIVAAVLQPGGFLAVLLFCLVLDALCLGIDNSALKRLLDQATASTRVDLFYMVLRLAGGLNILVFVFSFGSLFWVVNQIHHTLHIGFLSHVHSVLIQFAIVVVINTFVAYWGHRMMHTRWLWELHKVHHAAEEMNLVTPFRNHPLELVLTTFLNAFPVAVLGATPGVVIVYYGVNMIYQCLAHSEINVKGKLWDIIWITPAAHRIHHSNRVEHFDHNFGILTFWDYIFGTYHVPTNEKLTYGVDDPEVFNRSSHLLEVFDNVRRWLRPAWNHIAWKRRHHGTSPSEPVRHG